MQTAIQALGGSDAFAVINDTKIEATCTRTSNGTVETHLARWITAGEFFRFDGGDKDRRGFVHGPSGAHHVQADRILPVQKRSLRALKPIQLPGLLLIRDLAEPRNGIEFLGIERIDDGDVIHVRVTDAEGTEDDAEPQLEDWFFDAKTNLPIKLLYESPATNSLFTFIRSDVRYSNFQTVGSLVTPYTIKRQFEGGRTTTCAVTGFSVNNSPDPSVFEPTAGGSN